MIAIHLFSRDWRSTFMKHYCRFARRQKHPVPPAWNQSFNELVSLLGNEAVANNHRTNRIHFIPSEPVRYDERFIPTWQPHLYHNNFRFGFHMTMCNKNKLGVRDVWNVKIFVLLYDIRVHLTVVRKTMRRKAIGGKYYLCVVSSAFHPYTFILIHFHIKSLFCNKNKTKEICQMRGKRYRRSSRKETSSENVFTKEEKRGKTC